MAINKIIKFLHLAEKLKYELRHGWTSSGRQESVADHSWRVALLLILSAPHLNKRFNIEKALKMAIIHDLVEIYAGDTPFFKITNLSQINNKNKKERKALMKIKNIMGEEFCKEIIDLWNEFEDVQSYEAKIVKAFDKIEAQIQQNEADFSTWIDFEIKSALTYLDPYCRFDTFINSLMVAVRQESIAKMKRHGIIPENINNEIKCEI